MNPKIKDDGRPMKLPIVQRFNQARPQVVEPTRQLQETRRKILRKLWLRIHNEECFCS